MKLVHRHRFAEATAALAAHREAEAGREMTRRFVLPLLDIRSHALDAGTTPEVTDGDAHRRCRDSLVAPVLPHPPACFDFVWGDSLDAIARETQLGCTEEAVGPEVPDCPGAESVLSPLQFSGAGVTQCIVRVPRRSCVVGFVERGKRRQDQPCRSESHRLLRRVSYRASLHASHYCPNAQGSLPNTHMECGLSTGQGRAAPLFVGSGSAGGAHRLSSTSVSRLICAGWCRMT